MQTHVIRHNYCQHCRKFTLTSFRIIDDEYRVKISSGVPWTIKVRCIVCSKSFIRALTKSGWNDLFSNLAKKFMM
jgi:hypothetical protein